MKVRFSLFFFLLFASGLFAQTKDSPVKWSFVAKNAGKGLYDLVMTATVEDGWYTYSQTQEKDDGPLPTAINFAEGPHYKLVGKPKESGDMLKVFDKMFDMTVSKFKHKAIFTQRVEVKDPSKPIKGYIDYESCNDKECKMLGTDFSFSISDKDAAPAKDNKAAEPANQVGIGPNPSIAPPSDPGTSVISAAPANTAPGVQAPSDPNFKGFYDTKRAEINSAKFVNSCGAIEASNSIMGIFIGGFLGGLIALLTPCVFPMIPMTVSFFVKRSKDRKTGLRNAIWYGLSIILIYVGLGAAVSAAFGANALNAMSTDMWFNLAFFVIFLVFAMSFFGLFELTLPTSWVNSSDKMADKGGYLGIFFMAFTLALVSFSCTGPIVGSLLVEAAGSNNGAKLFGLLALKPTVGMFGFGLALSLPFTLFAIFPSWLHSLPKSGGWMDNVKITLGIVELALAFKFLSTADLSQHWDFLKFEAFLSVWILLSLMLATYQFGILNWKGAKGRPGPLRAAIAIGAVAFAAYMGWGLVKYQSLSLLSGLAPPVHYNFWGPKHDKNGIGCPHDLNCYHDFDEALAVAKRENKPLFVDFTGHGCVNCRKMEETVWDKPGIIDHLRNDYVVVSLYVDDKIRLFPDDKFQYLLDPNTNEKIRTVGDKWGKFQVNNFGVSSQPYYVLMYNDGKTILNQPRAFTPDVEQYRGFLDCGLEAFKKVRQNDGGLMGVK